MFLLDLHTYGGGIEFGCLLQICLIIRERS